MRSPCSYGRESFDLPFIFLCREMVEYSIYFCPLFSLLRISVKVTRMQDDLSAEGVVFNGWKIQFEALGDKDLAIRCVKVGNENIAEVFCHFQHST